MDLDEFRQRSMLPDPCGLLFGVPAAAPVPSDEDGRAGLHRVLARP